MEKRKLEKGDVVQINSSRPHETFHACLMVVTEPKSFGAVGYVKIPGKGLAHFRCSFEEMEYIGKAHLVAED